MTSSGQVADCTQQNIKYSVFVWIDAESQNGHGLLDFISSF